MHKVPLLVLLLIPLQSFADKTVVFQCDERKDIYDEKNTFCTISHFVVEHNQEVVYGHNMNTLNVKFMKCYVSVLLYIPYKLFEYFPNLQSLDISNSEILDISRNTFMSADNLLYLNMTSNKIKQLTTSIFVGAKNIHQIELAANEIAEVSEHAFKGLEYIDKITLSRNMIKNLSKNVFSDNINLKSIYLDHNLIEVLDPDTFLNNRDLRTIELSNNKLKFIHSDTFQNIFILESLQLSGNQIADFDLKNKFTLNRLALDNNNLTTLTIHSTKLVRANNNFIRNVSIHNMEAIDFLHLANNQITNITNITNLVNLVSLNLSSNKVGQNIGLKTFSKLRYLRELFMRNVSLSGVTFGMFSKQTALSVFDISFNNLKELNLDMLAPYMSAMKSFYIDGNNLSEIKGKSSFATAFPYLANIGLSKNRFNCSYLHSIITAPFLPPAVELHIEPDDSDIEKTHIRDITCIHFDDAIDSTKIGKKLKLTSSNQEIVNRTDDNRLTDNERALLMATIHNLQNQDEALKSHMLFMKIVLLLSGVLLMSTVIFKYMDASKRLFCPVKNVRDANIVFQSTTTVNTIEHM